MWRRAVIVATLIAMSAFVWLAIGHQSHAQAETSVAPQQVIVDPVTGSQRVAHVGDVVAVGEKQLDASGRTICVMPHTRVGVYGNGTVKSSGIRLQATDDCRLVIAELSENGR